MLLRILFLLIGLTPTIVPAQSPAPFGEEFPKLDSYATGRWWEVTGGASAGGSSPRRDPLGRPVTTAPLMVDRDDVLAFAVYTHQAGVLKLTAQLFPLLEDESRDVHLEVRDDVTGSWRRIQTRPVVYPGWSAHFRVDSWDGSDDVAYRLRHGRRAAFEGTIRHDPIEKDVIVLASMSCNSSRTPGPRPEMVDNLIRQDPDVLFFAGDQSYHHTQHTFGWLEFGLQFRDLIRDRPTITIPDDHDVGHPNLWGESGKRAESPDGADGGYFFPPAYVNMVQRCQTWHLPDPVDPAPVDRGIGVYFTRLVVGGIDFAILEDRKFKSGPAGKIPVMGPRPDHINDPAYDRDAIDLPGLQLLGDRQLKFLDRWGEDWTGAEIKAVLSQTAFCGAVHLHGEEDNRLLADLDCNGWPQSGRNEALRRIRRAWAPHLCGDQHLAVTLRHGIDGPADGPFALTSPAIVNTIYGRWWHPDDERPGDDPVPGSPLPWTGNYVDGLGNPIRMLAYANPPDRTDERQRGDGYAICRFDKPGRRITMECWPRFADLTRGDAAQYPGWPITIAVRDNDGRVPTGYLPTLRWPANESRVIQVIDNGDDSVRPEILYTVRIGAGSFRPPIYRDATYTVKVGADRPQTVIGQSLRRSDLSTDRDIQVP